MMVVVAKPPAKGRPLTQGEMRAFADMLSRWMTLIDAGENCGRSDRLLVAPCRLWVASLPVFVIGFADVLSRLRGKHAPPGRSLVAGQTHRVKAIVEFAELLGCGGGAESSHLHEQFLVPRRGAGKEHPAPVAVVKVWKLPLGTTTTAPGPTENSSSPTRKSYSPSRM